MERGSVVNKIVIITSLGSKRWLKQTFEFSGAYSRVQRYTPGWRGALMVSALVPGASGPCSSPGRGHCVVFFWGKIPNSHGASLHPGV